ncbi:RecQ family zinc-binding domain-containing protein [Adhaeribacter pallidiroseus]|uniref:DNA helicase n=1 Tax=Adhaeribacter pallidiroseus TaxID=2072847 RepID=A0A369QKM9_9BACT|nr:RecQ family zinc-binding domain-containing protein [Adhaeribacter pallidiroseus]RDC63776.1 DNA helicase [Adhaeribacter pallidiroseus]
MQKAEAVVAYMQSVGRCRTQLLLEYFGEISEEYCRVCDFCMARKKAKRQENHERLLWEQVMQHLTLKALHPKVLIGQFEPKFAPDLATLIRERLDKGYLHYDKEGKLHLLKN